MIGRREESQEILAKKLYNMFALKWEEEAKSTFLLFRSRPTRQHAEKDGSESPPRKCCPTTFEESNHRQGGEALKSCFSSTKA